ncbi:hypothetical protein D3C87_1990650 [compost metagenome]
MSETGTTEARYFCTNSGYSRMASEIEQKMMPTLANSSRKVVTTETESITASTATFGRSTPARISRSRSGTPSLSYMAISAGSTSSRLLGAGDDFGAA